MSDKNKKICLKCKAQCSSNATFCSECGYKFEKKSNKKLIVISLLILFILSLVSIGGVAFAKYQEPVSEYKSITPLNFNIGENLTMRQALDEMLKQEKDVLEYLCSNLNSQSNKDRIFATFYRNLIYLNTMNASDINSRIGFEDYDGRNKTVIDDVEFTPVVPKEEYEPAREFNITNPKTNLMKCIICEAGIYTSVLDFEYLKQNFAKYLSKPWQEFIELKLKQRNEIPVFYFDGYAPQKTALLEQIVLQREFLNKYPDFYINDLIKNDIKKPYMQAFLLPNPEDEYFDDDLRLTEKGKAIFNEFFKKINIESSEYKQVKECYNILKNNNFIINDNYRACAGE